MERDWDEPSHWWMRICNVISRQIVLLNYWFSSSAWFIWIERRPYCVTWLWNPRLPWTVWFVYKHWSQGKTHSLRAKGRKIRWNGELSTFVCNDMLLGLNLWLQLFTCFTLWREYEIFGTSGVQWNSPFQYQCRWLGNTMMLLSKQQSRS